MSHNYSRLLVVLQFALSAVLVLSVKATSINFVSVVTVTYGVAFGLWAVWKIGPHRVSIMPDVKESTHLQTGGPYRWVRHPMYTALLVFTLGCSISPPAVWKVIAFVLLALVLNLKATIEERQLRSRFPDYQDYASNTKRFIPLLW